MRCEEASELTSRTARRAGKDSQALIVVFCHIQGLATPEEALFVAVQLARVHRGGACLSTLARSLAAAAGSRLTALETSPGCSPSASKRCVPTRACPASPRPAHRSLVSRRLQDTIKVEPRDFDKEPAEAIREEIHRRYANRVRRLFFLGSFRLSTLSRCLPNSGWQTGGSSPS